MTIQFKVKNQMLADYLRYLFPPDDGALRLNSEHAIGKLFIAHCHTADRPVPIMHGDNIVMLRLPLCNATQSLNNKFLYYSSADIAQLNLALKAYFDIDFMGYYRRGEAAEFSKRDIVEAFILSRRLISSDNFDALHKRVYRRQQEQYATLQRKLQRKAYYIDESLNTKGIEK